MLSAVLLKDYVLNDTSGELIMTGFIPANRLNFPEGATHVSLLAGFLNLGFDSGIKDLQLSNVVNLPINGTTSNVTLTPAGIPAGTGQKFFFLKAAFFQEINTVQYPLKNGAFNALKLLIVVA